jgi:hypothetical protein
MFQQGFFEFLKETGYLMKEFCGYACGNRRNKMSAKKSLN